MPSISIETLFVSISKGVSDFSTRYTSVACYIEIAQMDISMSTFGMSDAVAHQPLGGFNDTVDLRNGRFLQLRAERDRAFGSAEANDRAI